MILAFLLSLVCVCLNDVAVSWGFTNMQRVVVESLDEIAYGMLRTQKSFGTNKFNINVKRIDGRKMVKPVITFTASGTTPPYTITVQEAELHCDTRRKVLVIAFEQGLVQAAGQASYHFNHEEREISLQDASGKQETKTSAGARGHEGRARRDSLAAGRDQHNAARHVGAGRVFAGGR